MATIDIEALRDYLIDYCGALASMGFSSAVDDVFDLEDASDEEVLYKAKEMGVNLKKYEKED